MFNPLAFATSTVLDATAAETCGCACESVVGVVVDDWIIIVY